MRAAPYPYERWPKLSRGASAVASALARMALHTEGSPAQRMIAATASVLGRELHVVPGPARVWSGSELRAAFSEPLAAIELELRLDELDHRIVLELTCDLAGALVDRTLDGDSAAVRAPGLALDELELGVLGYLAARAAAAGGGKLRIRSVTTSRDAALRALGDEIVVWPLALDVGATAGSARVLVPLSTGRAWLATTPSRRRFDVPSALLGLSLRLCAHAATVRLTAGELDSLAPGDVVVPERTALATRDGSWYGHATLHALGGPSGHRARCELDHRGLCIAAFEQGEVAMSDESGPETLVKDAPIELCVELARFNMRLEDVLGLRVGEVLQTGRAIGERVLLTANGRAIARGELVDIEGDVGVRILEKL